MRAILGGEDENGVGLRVIDNNEISHGIHVAFDGEITYHEQDRYPDKPAERTSEEKEYVSQARRFARYYVYRERGYQTLSAEQNPDRIEATRQVLESLETDEWMEYLGEFHQQCASHYDEAVEAVIEPPLDVGVDADAFGGIKTLLAANTPASLRELFGLTGGKNLFYCQNLYLEVDSAAVTELLESVDLEAEFDPEADPTEQGFWATIGRLAADQEYEISELFDIEAVGPLYGMVHGPDGETITDHDEPLEREPDARIQHMPVPPQSPAEFRDAIDVHLRCQIRDCYLTMGCLAPEWTRITGAGFPKAIYRYGRTDRYQPYYDPDADIDWERLPMSPR